MEKMYGDPFTFPYKLPEEITKAIYSDLTLTKKKLNANKETQIRLQKEYTKQNEK